MPVPPWKFSVAGTGVGKGVILRLVMATHERLPTAYSVPTTAAAATTITTVPPPRTPQLLL